MEITVRTPKGRSQLRTGSGISVEVVKDQIKRMQELDETYPDATWDLYTEYAEVPIPDETPVRYGDHRMIRQGHEQEDREAIDEAQGLNTS